MIDRCPGVAEDAFIKSQRTVTHRRGRVLTAAPHSACGRFVIRVRTLALASPFPATCKMRSQYRCSSSDKRDSVRDALVLHGYDDVFCADTSDRRTVVVIHPDAYAARVDSIIHRVDLAAVLTARTCTD
jgi:hypothetical protein